MRRLVWAFAGLKYHIVGNLILRLKRTIYENTFNRKAHLKKHFKVHMRLDDQECKICNKQYKYMSRFKAYLLTHTEDLDPSFKTFL